jgi:mono/diheme cytochrome c family protein
VTGKPSPQLARENPDPQESGNPLPIPFVLFFAATAAVALTYLLRHHGPDSALAGDQRSPQRIVSTEVTGEGTYQKICTACHQANGAGVPNAFPPLAGSPWLLDDRETPIRVVLFGLSGPITVEGKSFVSVMPPFKDQLSDREIALVLTHVRSSFGNQAPPIAEADVAAVRASLAGRTQSWAGGAALEEARKTTVLPVGSAP